MGFADEKPRTINLRTQDEFWIKIGRNQYLQACTWNFSFCDCDEMTGRSSHKKKKLSFDRHTASTQGCVSTANSYLTKCPKASHAICSMLLQMSSNVFCSTLKLQGSSGSQRISSIIRNAEKPTGRKGSPFFTRVQPVFWKTISLFLGTWDT